MNELISLMGHYGWLPVVIAVGLYILLRGQFTFRYPRK
jgi:hypothetical protein